MILDAFNQFSSDQAVTADAISENVIDLGPLGGGNLLRDIGAGEPLYISILVKTALTDADGDPTLAVTLESDDAEALTTATVHATLATGLAKATLIAGYWIAQNWAIPAADYQRYLGLRYTTTTADFDGGTVDAWLHIGRFDTRTYESGFSTGVN
ncbi:MAG: hypothetical protein IT337_15175 [Thermomicrobiales bacterium]|nr:hypothetical protein [Thermomicrobiales bacterium]